jgi:hypothetical protein
MTVKTEQATPTGTPATTYQHAPTETIDIGGTRFAYRQLGADTGVPVGGNTAKSRFLHASPGDVVRICEVPGAEYWDRSAAG